MPNSAPIGVFDSGIGGLTVVHELIRQLPRESIVYFGDTARVPYGPKSPETVRRYSREIAAFLREQGVKNIVIACNTATAHALTALREDLPMPVVGVVEPGARAAVSASTRGHVGVIGTVGTIKSGAYERAIRALNPDIRVTARACPLFVPLVEEGWTEHDAARLIDSAEETAAETARTLAAGDLCAPNNADPSYRFVASDDPLQFLQLGQRFLGGTMEGVEIRTLG